MAPSADIKDNRWFKTVRISVVGVIGSTLGYVAAGPIGSVLGGAAASTAAGIATSLADGFWGDALLTKPNPRRFATDVLMPIIATRTRPIDPLENIVVEPSSPPSGSVVVSFSNTHPAEVRPPVHAPPPAETRIAVDERRQDRNRRKAARRRSPQEPLRR